MSSPRSLNFRTVRTVVLGMAIMAIATLGSYTGTRAWRAWRADVPLSEMGSALSSLQGEQVVAYLFLSSQCGFCTDAKTTDAIIRLRDSLLVSNAGRFARLEVVGVALDEDLGRGSEYLLDLTRRGAQLDQVMVGGGWMNEGMRNYVWRDGLGRPEVPQVLALARSIDASGYPRHIEVGPDAAVLRVVGRDDVIAWVNRGARIPQRLDSGTAVPDLAPTRP